MPGNPAATDPELGTAGGAARTAKPRRRVRFRKGAALDEELWPTETFGGVSDEQFWDDLASDKPLATTARTAQQDAPGKNRPPAGAPGTGPDPAAERTAIQPAYAATQPAQSMKSQLPGATQPVRVAASTQPRRGRPSSTDEDPLTSAAFSLRPSGPVDGRSSLRARNASADRHGTISPSPSPYPAPSYGDSSSVTQMMATPPDGQDYGYGRGDPAARAGEPRRRNGTGSHARPDGAGEGTRTARHAYPRHSYQITGSYPGNGYQTGPYPVVGRPGGGYPGGSYPGTGHRGNGHRAPYDPRNDYRRLTRQH